MSHTALRNLFANVNGGTFIGIDTLTNVDLWNPWAVYRGAKGEEVELARFENRPQALEFLREAKAEEAVAAEMQGRKKVRIVSKKLDNPMQGRVQKRVTGSSVMVFQNKNTNAYENMVHRRLEAEGMDPANFVLGPREWGNRIPNTPFVEHTVNDEDRLYLEVIFLKAGEVEYLLDGNPIAKSAIQGLKPDPEPTGQGGLSKEKQVVIRDYDVRNITNVRIDNAEYRLTRPVEIVPFDVNGAIIEDELNDTIVEEVQ